MLWTEGYSAAELAAAQERHGLRFPPDLEALLRERRPFGGWDWRIDDAGIRAALAAPLEGLLYDLEHNDLWWPEWGERPATAAERAEVLHAVARAAPRLIPLIGHRYLPETPHAAGNPVFSVMQSDVIHYGVDLADYFEREAGRPYRRGPHRHIRFWSDLVERNRMSM